MGRWAKIKTPGDVKSQHVLIADSQARNGHNQSNVFTVRHRNSNFVAIYSSHPDTISSRCSGGNFQSIYK